MITLNKLDAFDADRLHRKLNRMWRACDERLARRRYRIMCGCICTCTERCWCRHERVRTISGRRPGE